MTSALCLQLRDPGCKRHSQRLHGRETGLHSHGEPSLSPSPRNPAANLPETASAKNCFFGWDPPETDITPGQMARPSTGTPVSFPSADQSPRARPQPVQNRAEQNFLPNRGPGPPRGGARLEDHRCHHGFPGHVSRLPGQKVKTSILFLPTSTNLQGAFCLIF